METDDRETAPETTMLGDYPRPDNTSFSDPDIGGILPTTENADQTPQRETWGKKIDFAISALGVAVGLGNLWRFPYLCYRNGGGAFLIPYLVSLVCAGIPMLILEVAIGQYMSTGCLDAWKVVPGFQGIGIGTLIISFLSPVYYTVVLAWITYYAYSSLTSVLPWSHCDNDWNTDRCFVSGTANLTNISTNLSQPRLDTSSNSTVDSSVEFWERKVLQRSGGVDEPGRLVPELALSLLFSWVVVFFCIFRGVRWSGKVAYVTVIFPYVLLLILLIRSVTLDGAVDGIIYYLKPDFERLRHAQVWVDGLSQVFFSNAVASGSLIMLGSYNPFKNDFYRDSLIVSVANSCTSVIGGFAVFSVLGFMAKEQNMRVQDVAESGPGLVFIAYPKAVTQMPAAPLWSVLFFLMIFLLGIDSQFVTTEGFLTPIMDRFPKVFYNKPRNRMLLVLAICVLGYLIGLCMITQGGAYVFELFNYYVANGIVLLWISFFQSVTIGWVFGAAKFYDAIELMTGRRIGPWMKIGWMFLTPIITLGTLIFAASKYQPLTYDNVYEYPTAAHAVGAVVSLCIMGSMPGYLLWCFLTNKGSLKQRWKRTVTPALKPHQIPAHWRRDGYFIKQDYNNGRV